MTPAASLAARFVLACSGAVAAFVVLLPAAIAGLIFLFDLSTHGLLGMSGTLLGFATPFGSGAGGLATYRGVTVDLPRTAFLSLLRGVPPVAMIAFAVIQPRIESRRHWAWATAAALVAFLTANWFALPGGLAGLLLACTPASNRAAPSGRGLSRFLKTKINK